MRTRVVSRVPRHQPTQDVHGRLSYVYDAPKHEMLSSDRPQAEGTFAVTEWPGCHKGESVRFVVDATLSSTKVEGEIEAVIGEYPGVTRRVEGEIVAVIGDPIAIHD